MLFKQRSHVRKIAVEPENPSIADRFAEVMVRLHLEHDLEPDVLAAAEDVLRVFRARKKKVVRFLLPLGMVAISPVPSAGRLLWTWIEQRNVIVMTGL
jgi:hypothetical protein